MKRNAARDASGRNPLLLPRQMLLVPDGGNVLTVAVRPAQESDIPEIDRLWANRRHEALPGHNQYVREQLERPRANAEAELLRYVRGMGRNGREFFACVALVDRKIAGYALAEAPLNDEYCYYRGLAVDGRHHHGVGRALEEVRGSWAASLGRPVVVRVAAGNTRAERFFRLHGFVRTSTAEPTADNPVTYGVYQRNPDTLTTPVDCEIGSRRTFAGMATMCL